MTNLLIIVPARGGSKRVPGKNLRQLAGRTLLAHTAEAIEASALGAPVILSTDDDDIAREGKRLGWQVPFRRPAELSSDDAPTIAGVLHAVDWYAEAHGADPKATMVLQTTSPLRGGYSLREAVGLLSDRADFDSVIAMTESHVPPAQIFFSRKDGVAVPVSGDWRRPVYRPNGALYLARTAAIRASQSLYAGTIAPLVLDPIRSIDIDTEQDLRLAEAALEAGLPLEESEISLRHAPKSVTP